MQLSAAEQLARRLMRQHGLTPTWEFAFDRAVRRFGSCNWSRKRITLSAKLTLLNDEGQVRDTILHEIAHALTTPRTGHGPKWKAIARSIGCTAERCYGDDVVSPEPKFLGRCPRCSTTIRRNRRKRLSCGKCDRRFNPTYLLIWAAA
jgi:predicted SprT family Zn-dependent metalloprotease